MQAYPIDEQTRKSVRELALKAEGEPLDAPSLAILSSY